MDSADQMSYWEALVGLLLVCSGLMLLERSFDLCRCKDELSVYISNKDNDQIVLLRYFNDCDCPRHGSPGSLLLR